MKKMLVFLLIVSVIVFLAGCGNATQQASEKGGEAKEIVLKAGHSVPPTHPYHLGLERFAQLINERTEGKVKIEIFHSAQLGNERDMIEGLQMNTLDMVVSSTGPIGGFEPKMLVVDLPFLFRDREHAYKVLDGDIGNELLSSLTSKNIVGLAFWENGFRQLTNSKKSIETVEDIQGLKVRTMENEVHMDAFKELGADPTPMAWSEVFTALQQKVIDGQENPIPIIYSTKVYEVQKHLALTEHFYSPALLLMSKGTFDKLDENTKQIFTDTAKEVATYERGLIKEMEDKQIKELKTLGMKVTIPDKAKLQERVKPVYAKYEKEFTKDLIDRIINTK
ncbi:TRAP transporter substrate-binding protein [Clostridiaceae bacterium 35-E11]